jgi:alpha-tubulin suppressor-like RCC1 family protein
LDYQGRVYSFGRGEFGQLGLNDTEDRFTPTLIPNLLVV